MSIGYKHFDCAWLYGNEDVIGAAFKEAIAESNGSLKREDLFIVSKVWNSFHSRNAVRKCFEETIKNLDVDYLDLYLVHWPMGFAVILLDWRILINYNCFFSKKENSGAFPKDEKGNVIFSDVHYLDTYKVKQTIKVLYFHIIF